MESIQFLKEYEDSIHKCFAEMFPKSSFEIVDCSVETISKSVNFTTDRIFRIHGNAEVGNRVCEWSIVVKVIKPDSQEKNHPNHHNYWKREGLIHSSGLLAELPSVINTPKCYLVEEKPDGTIWIWMDEVKEDNHRQFSQDEWGFIARQVGLLNGAYLSNMPIPQESWICRSWLRSWVDGCKRYATDPFQSYQKIRHRFPQIEPLWARFLRLDAKIDKHISALNLLPRVLAHQDLSKGNMYISTHDMKRTLTLIDWQFLSISGLGEDLGKLYGVAMSQGNIPSDKYDVYKEILFQNYLDGLSNAGWQGGISIPKYGFCVSVSVRSAWEIPRLLATLADSDTSEMTDKTLDLIRINEIHMDCAEEAERLVSLLGRE